jgi:hypothetical protein
MQFSIRHASKKLDSKLTLINFILIKCEFLKVEEAKVKSAISSLGNLIISSENFFLTTWIFGVESRPEL